MSEVSMFPRYSGENKTTNFCLRMMKLLYEEHPRLLEDFLSELLEGRVGNLGIRIRQQVDTDDETGRIMDGLVQNRPFDIGFEFKSDAASFGDEKLSEYLDSLNAHDDESAWSGLIAVGKEDDLNDIDVNRVQSETEGTFFYMCTYEKFVDSVESVDLPDKLEEFASELREYLNYRDLLPEWEHKLLVKACSEHAQEIIDEQRYMSDFRSYQKSKYFGVYSDKRVEAIAKIRAVVDVYNDRNDSEVHWQNSDEDEASLIEEAVEEAEKDPRDEKLIEREGCRVFLLDGMEEIEFKKETKNPLPNMKYFDVAGIDSDGLTDLAEELDGKSWSEVEQS
jgi:hypothetical protein